MLRPSKSIVSKVESSRGEDEEAGSNPFMVEGAARRKEEAAVAWPPDPEGKESLAWPRGLIGYPRGQRAREARNASEPTMAFEGKTPWTRE